MNKNKTARIVAFIGALGASAALIGARPPPTPAPTSPTPRAAITGTSFGNLTLNGVGDSTSSFADLVPGEYQTQTVKYNTNTGSVTTRTSGCDFDRDRRPFTGGRATR